MIDSLMKVHDMESINGTEKKAGIPMAMLRLGKQSSLILPAVTIIAMLLVWEGLVRTYRVTPYILPAPTAIFRELVSKIGLLMMHTWSTLLEVIVGYLASVVVGLPLAVFIVQSRAFESAVYPLLLMSQNVPKMAIAPLFVVWLGFGIAPKILVVFLIAFFPIVIDGIVGLRAIRPEMLQLARSMGASRYQVFRLFRFPNALPVIFGGLKVGMTLAVVGAIVGEFIGGDRGLGYLLEVTAFNFQTALLFATIIILVALGMLMFLVIVIFEKLLIPWETERIRRQETGATL